MANWITSKTGLSNDGNNPTENIPVNLDFVESFERTSGNCIKFNFQNSEPIEWYFINATLRDDEHSQILTKIKAE